MNRAPVKFIYFDAGLTLIHPHPSIGHHYAAVAAEYGVEGDPESLESGFVRAWRNALGALAPNSGPPYGRTLDEARGFWISVVEECFGHVGLSLPTDPRFQRDLFERFADASAWRLFDDTLPALRYVEAAGIPWGILSNWDLRLRPLLHGFGLIDRLSTLVISSEVGHEKPTPAIFDHARELVGGLPPESIALIGDDLEADAAGALAAGWQTRLIVRHPASPPDTRVPIASDLLSAVESLIAPGILPAGGNKTL